MKAKEIDEIFENQGYYISLKIYIGGIFINRYNDKNYKLFKEDINLSGKDIRKIFINENTQIIGGEKSEKNFELWTQSVQISNSNIIECSNIIETKNILPNQLKEKLQKPLQLVEVKYLKRTKYIEYINSLKDIKLSEKKDIMTFQKEYVKKVIYQKYIKKKYIVLVINHLVIQRK